jgi:putative DNA primase/helicase
VRTNDRRKKNMCYRWDAQKMAQKCSEIKGTGDNPQFIPGPAMSDAPTTLTTPKPLAGLSIDEIQCLVERKVESERQLYEVPDEPAPAPAMTNGRRFSEDGMAQCLDDGPDGDAWLFAEIHRDRFIFDHSENQCFEFVGHSWRPDILREHVTAVDSVIDVYAQGAARMGWLRAKAEQKGEIEKAKAFEAREGAFLHRINQLHSLRRKKEVLELASVGASGLGISGQEWDSNPMLLGVSNGVVNLCDGSFSPGRPEDYIRKPSPTEWMGIDEPCPQWIRFLDSIFEAEPDLIAFVQRLLGYGVTGVVREAVFPVLWGGGRNGKTILVETVRHVMGPLAGPIPPEMFIDSGHTASSSGPSADKMALRGRRLAWASESGQGATLNLATMKRLTGGDSISARPPYGKHQIEFEPTHKTLFLTNAKPRVPTAEIATWERIVLIPFRMSFVAEPDLAAPRQRKADPALLDRLKGEAPGILGWLVKGCLAWQAEGLNPPPVVRQATDAYRADEDYFTRFISEYCVLSPQAMIKAGALHEAYSEWCVSNGLRKSSSKAFTSFISERFERTPRTKHGFFYRGIGLLANEGNG